jgi:hypothetical protein
MERTHSVCYMKRTHSRQIKPAAIACAPASTRPWPALRTAPTPYKCTQMCLYIYVHVYICVQMCMCMYIYVYVYICVCIYMYTNVFVYICVQMCMYMYMYAHKHTHRHTHTSSPLEPSRAISRLGSWPPRGRSSPG